MKVIIFKETKQPSEKITYVSEFDDYSGEPASEVKMVLK